MTIVCLETRIVGLHKNSETGDLSFSGTVFRDIKPAHYIQRSSKAYMQNVKQKSSCSGKSSFLRKSHKLQNRDILEILEFGTISDVCETENCHIS